MIKIRKRDMVVPEPPVRQSDLKSGLAEARAAQQASISELKAEVSAAHAAIAKISATLDILLVEIAALKSSTATREPVAYSFDWQETADGRIIENSVVARPERRLVS